jgi:hypothetical protein
MTEINWQKNVSIARFEVPKALNSQAELKDVRVIGLFAQIPSFFSSFNSAKAKTKRISARDAISLTFFAGKSKRAAYESLSKAFEELYSSIEAEFSHPHDMFPMSLKDGIEGARTPTDVEGGRKKAIKPICKRHKAPNEMM